MSNATQWLHDLINFNGPDGYQAACDIDPMVPDQFEVKRVEGVNGPVWVKVTPYDPNIHRGTEKSDLAPPEVIAALERNLLLCEDDLARALAAASGVVDKDDLNVLSRALNDAKVRLAWAKVGVPL